MKRLITFILLTAALLASGLTSTSAQNNCQPCFQQATYQQNVIFNQCRDGEGCSDPDCSNCVGEGLSARQDYINSTCPSCYDPLLDRPVAACPPMCVNGAKIEVRYKGHWRHATVIGTWTGNDFYVWVSIDGTKWIPLIANDRADVRAR